jgi:hypothetical protein
MKGGYNHMAREMTPQEDRTMDEETKEFLREIAEQLERWAGESKSGGWSTHQVTPQLLLSERIYNYLGRKA